MSNTAPPAIKQWSPHQQAIFKLIRDSNKSLLIKATAGSGKTTTLVECSKLFPQRVSKQFLAFNKSIVNELKERLPHSVSCNTFHSLGMSFLYRAKFKINKVNTYKTLNIIDEFFKEDFEKQFKEPWKSKATVQDLIDFIRLNYLQPTLANFIKISKTYDIPVSPEELTLTIRVWDKLSEVNRKGLKKQTDIDFIDMLYLPVQLNLIETTQVIMVDECQDMSLLQIEFVNRMCEKNTRIVSVGDPYQSIYFFAGASTESFKSFEKICGHTLPLSVTYRVPKKGVALAKLLCPDIQTHDGAIDGEINKKATFDDIQHGDYVLCRNELPLIICYTELLRRGLNARVRGNDIELKLRKHVKNTKGSDIEDVIDSIEDDLLDYAEKMKNRQIDDITKTKGYFDRKICIQIIQIMQESFQLETKRQLADKLNDIFQDKKQGDFVDLMTIHKSKGLEADNIFLIDKYNGKPLIPSIWATTESELQQERNLLFVALTRFKKKLGYIAC